MPPWRSQAAVPSLSFWPFWQTTTTDLPWYSVAHCSVGAVVAAHGARHQPRVGPVIVIDAHIDDSRRLRKADETGKLSGGDCGD